MALSKQERAAINKQNARKSTGPSSPEGKARARRNALKHGLRATLLALPGEDPEAVQAREDAWNDYYQPRSPAAQHLVNECAAATLLADRVNRHHHAVLEKELREAEARFEHDREDQVAALAARLADDPAAVTRDLCRTAHGCRWMIERWGRLADALEQTGFLVLPQLDEAIRLLGFGTGAGPGGDPDGYEVRLFGVLGWPNAEEALPYYLHPDQVPPSLRPIYRLDRAEALGDRARNVTLFKEIIAEQVDALRGRAAHLEATFDAPDRAAAGDRALVPSDGPSARLILRYRSEARTAFHRSYSELVKTLARDAERAAAGAAGAEPPNEADPETSPSPAGTSVDVSAPAAGANPAPGRSGAVGMTAGAVSELFPALPVAALPPETAAT